MTRYILTKRVFNTLIGRNYKLLCKICGKAFLIARCPKCDSAITEWKRNEPKYICKKCKFSDFVSNLDGCIESKPSKYRGRRKFYHCRCYDDSHIELPNGDSDES